MKKTFYMKKYCTLEETQYKDIEQLWKVLDTKYPNNNFNACGKGWVDGNTPETKYFYYGVSDFDNDTDLSEFGEPEEIEFDLSSMLFESCRIDNFKEAYDKIWSNGEVILELEFYLPTGEMTIFYKYRK